MKKLRQTLAIVLAVVMLVSVIPFSVNAASADAVFSIAAVNNQAYDSNTVIRSGDTVDVAVTLNRSSSEQIYTWMLGYAFDSNALSYVGIKYPEPQWVGQSSPSTSGDYELLGAMLNYDYVATYEDTFGTEILGATLTFKVKNSFTGTAAISANQGTADDNFFTIFDGSDIFGRDITAQGLSFEVYENTDKTLLKAQLERYAALDDDDYTPNSWEAVATAFPTAQSVYDNVAATQVAIDNATAALKDALDALVEIANTTELRKKINEAKREATLTSLYTADSINALKSAITHAEGVYSDRNVLQATVDAEVIALQSAIDALEKNNVSVVYYNPDGETVFKQVEVQYGSDITPIEEHPEKPADETYTYTFDHWEGNFSNITETTYLTPVYNKEYIVYRVTFLDDDGETPVAPVQEYHYGETLTPPAAPTKEATAQYTYTFEDWSPALSETVTGDATYTATYTATVNKYTITFLNENGDLIEAREWEYGATPAPEVTPTKPADEQYTYTFAGWEEGAVVPVTGEATYTAKFEGSTNQYTVIFLDEDGTQIGETQTLDYGATVTIPEDPTKEATAQYTYTFSGWTPAVAETVTGNATYRATYRETVNQYTITFLNEDGSNYIDPVVLDYGATITLPEDPTKEATAQYTYTFSGWNPEVELTVTGDATYTATFSSTVNKYTITFLNDKGELIEAKEWEYGATPALAADPTKEATAQYTYTFAGWEEGEIQAVTGEATYTAKFTSQINSYTVTFYNGEEVFATATYDYGAVPAAPEGTPTKEKDETYYYVFSQWSPAFEAVTGECSYTAVFDKFYLDADYSKLSVAIANASTLSESDYTSVSYARLFNALAEAALDENQDLKINEQSKVDSLEAAITAAVAALVSDNDYKALYAECAAVNNDNNLYKVASYEAFLTAFAALPQKDFNTEEATQAQVNAEMEALRAALNLLETANTQIVGAKQELEGNALLTSSNTSKTTTALQYEDGGANISELKFYTANGDEITNAKKTLGTGCRVDLVQGNEVKISKTLIVYGDIDGDGQVTLLDIRLAKKMAVSEDGFESYQILAAKCGGETVNVDEVINLAKAI